MKREGAWHAPSRALRRTVLDRRRGGKKIKGEKKKVQERVRRKLSEDKLKEAETEEDHREETRKLEILGGLDMIPER